ncbi:hypothetical protein BgiMline_030887 [Biomphalaria glabrata]|uniref:Uncharacterized protein LOC106055203 n=1 Tax=Biomphalaria glabrata TaxID=6526 RepID=A0A2C9KV77_BIOGL|nr:uncharacterized protein LOC106055203 [Biomphalaria glabrata]XP_055866952.1 uncharacterized protein LOC106055203 [Biomphalaria glabrata]XP_055866953.1 uncharacterized protein LOC106055203 [Biomphalaria glabrata]XP_055866954.1 uncharacterized protein LOC106055203 [Biomphalaria glabrata]XP_055866955.1 uncharacterized protein LOC106055203 [Biomphalaria glabrata]XP_055866956.1 uncharacterized protein LOC106055203 [Biomphalaria glabrata]XP_055866957.1 uncharacterized protein LOC106055203 [Biomph
MATQRYSTAQKIAFAGMTIGFVMCTVGCIAPFWQTGKIDSSIITSNIDLGSFNGVLNNLPKTELAKMYGGLWWYCEEVILVGRECHVYELDGNKIEDWAIRGLAVLSVFLSLVCTLAALCRSCCCEGGKTVCHGVMAFLSGACGLAVVGLFVSTTSDGFAMKLNLEGFGWALFVFAAGAAIITVVSFILCFASPMNPFAGIIIDGVSHIMPNGYSRMTSEHQMQQQAAVTFNPPATNRY